MAFRCASLRCGDLLLELEIRIPKPEQKKPNTVQITLGANPDTKTIESADPHNGSEHVHHDAKLRPKSGP